MATPVAGKVSELQVGTSAADTLVKGRVDWNFNVDKTEIDGSHMDIDDGWSLYLQGRKNATLTGTLRYIEDDPGQTLLIANTFGDGDELFVAFKFSATGDTYATKGFVTNMNPTAPDEDVTNMSFSMRLTGGVEVS